MQIKRDDQKRYLAIAIPMVLATAAAPLPGIVDTAILGHLDSVIHLSAVAAGSTVIATVIWLFGFLRMGTTATTSRAWGADDSGRCSMLLAQSLALAAAIGLAIVVVRQPILAFGFHLIAPPGETATLAMHYAEIRILAAPAALGTFCICGWLIGVQQARWALLVMLTINLLNVVLDFVLILGLGMNSIGAAWASCIAESVGLFVGLWVTAHLAPRFKRNWPWRRLRDWQMYREILTVNRHLLIRTMCLMFVFAFFTAQGARQGQQVLAANAILMQLFLLFAFALDGFAHATEALTGAAIGARNQTRFYGVCTISALWGGGVTSLISVLYLICDSAIIALFTDIQPVAALAASHFIWLAAMPLVSVWSFMLDGVFLGAGKTRDMQNIMIIAVFAVFLPAWLAGRAWGNDGLWFAFLLFMAARTVLMADNFVRTSKRGWLPAVQPREQQAGVN